ncbi:hypothetical protein [Lysobacter sp. CA199]|uniref:hypothetical protein n=1 Tax=Lysobacter sp. CA199 TaxID=3455608 RepID=UPI003F8D0821
MKMFRMKRYNAMVFAAVFAAAAGFGIAHADNGAGVACQPWPGCDFGGGWVFCCVPE